MAEIFDLCHKLMAGIVSLVASCRCLCLLMKLQTLCMLLTVLATGDWWQPCHSVLNQEHFTGNLLAAWFEIGRPEIAAAHSVQNVGRHGLMASVT